MNKRYALLFVIFFLVVLFVSIKVYSVNFGTCLNPATGSCNYVDADQVGCDTNLDFIFYQGKQKHEVANCTKGCCCGAKISNPKNPVYHVIRGKCEIYLKSLFLDVSEQECYTICDVKKPLCSKSCVLNTKDCVGRRGRIINVGVEGGYYCWENNESYGTPESCIDNCGPIGKCTPGAAITKDCYCGGNLYSSGFCCWANSYNDTSANCPPANDCQKHSEMGKFFECCDDCKDSGFTYPTGDYDGSVNKCPQEKPSCCKDCAPPIGGCCDFAWQCEGTVLRYTPSSCSSPNVPCDTGCVEPICVPGQKINEANLGYPMCKCGEEYYDALTDSRYCCPGGASPSPCGVGTFDIFGDISDTHNSSKIEGAYTSLKTKTPLTLKSSESNENGDYFIEGIPLCSGYFNISVIKIGYYSMTYTEPCPAESTTLSNRNINLTPVEVICGDFPPVDSLSAKAVRGKKEVNVTWEAPASTPSQIIGYSIRRDNFFTLGTFFTTAKSFIDYDAEWGSTYNYFVSVLYASGGISPEAIASIITGSEHCEGIFDDNEFCLGNKRYKCDINNNDALGYPKTCNPGNVCYGPDEKGVTSCKKEIKCREKGNPFGLFCDGTDCLKNEDYCYYDYSNTIVDECNNCSKAVDCYSYISKDACEKDNCKVSGAYLSEANSNCKWHYTFEEFGKGFCYDEDYNGTGYCELCNKEGDLFYNVNCYQNICTKLGSCYSKDSSCEACSGARTCEDFDNEDSCVNSHSLGSRNRSINGCHTPIIKSDDACGLGACKWGDPNEEGISSCFKDANNDNMPDCGEGEVGCEDFEPFNTEPQTDAGRIRMNALGGEIKFYLEEGGEGVASSFYFCIDKDNSCCPNIPADIQSYVIINPVDEDKKRGNIITDVGGYFIRYYSIDTNDNVEEVKSTEFFVDPLKSVITTSHIFYNESGHIYTEITVVSDECVKCSYELDGIPKEKVRDHNFDSSGNEFFIKFEDLNDSNYIFTTVCNDSVKNSVRNDYSFYVDFVHQIEIGYPNMERLNITQVKFHLTTSDNCTCVLEAVDASSSGIPYNTLPGEPFVVMDKVELVAHKLYNYTKTVTLVGNVSYIVQATCTPVMPGPVDYGLFHFTIDKQAPITSTSFDFSVWHKLDPSNGLVTIKLDCEDPKINGYPGEGGCKGIYLCSGLNCHNIEKSYGELVKGEYQTNVNGLHISYYSIDNLGNKEDRYTTGHYNQWIRIDGSNPAVNINQPTAEITNNEYQTVIVTASDTPSEIDYVQIKIEKVDTGEVSIVNATREGTSNDYEANVKLDGGQNLITATGCDKASNCVQDSHKIYLDIYGPEIFVIQIADSEFDPELDANNIFEYMQGLSFAAKIEDKYDFREGIGVNPSKVNLLIYNGNGVVTKVGMISGEDNNYNQTITQVLPIGIYDATVEAYDKFGNYNNWTVSFEIRDTIPPRLALIPELPSTVYMESYEITGITDPNLQVMVTILDKNWANPEYYRGISDGAVIPQEEFKDKKMGDIKYDYPLKGESLIMLKGDWSGILFTGDYLEFSNHNKIPRYEIIDRGVVSIGFDPVTRITIDPPLEKSVDSAIYMVSAFTSAYPSGWFNIPINFKEGNNTVVVSVMGGIRDLVKEVMYDAGGFDIILKNPFDGIINYVDFANAGNAIPLQIKTERDGANFKAICKVSHISKDIVSDAFRDIPMATTDNIVHTFTINANSCKEKGGSYCLIGGTSKYPINYHHYMINCTPTDVPIKFKVEPVCFTVATYGKQMSTERGVNICSSSTGCSSSEPSPCASAINCQDTIHSSSQSNCISEGICRWSIGYGCGTTCHTGFVDDDGDGVCVEPSINCADYNGNRDSCLSQGVCKWCPSIATAHANECLQNNCNSCGSLTYDSDPLDGECDGGGEGQGGWGD